MAIKNTIELLQKQINPVQLLVVTKTRSANDIRQVVDAGVRMIGENKLQEIQNKFDAELLQELEQRQVELHFLGHLQTNKVSKVIQYCDVIQSVDSLKLALSLNQATGERNKTLPIFLQLNLTGEDQKYGFREEELSGILPVIQELPHLQVRGFMCMGKQGDEKQTRNAFRHCKDLSDQYQLDEVSMGMSDDYQIALEEGSTMVRMGSIVFRD